MATVNAYVLSEEDENGRNWDLSKWESRGKGEIRILQPSGKGLGNIRVVMKSTDSNDKTLTNHLVHPETVFRTGESGHSRMLWVQDERKGKFQTIQAKARCMVGIK